MLRVGKREKERQRREERKRRKGIEPGSPSAYRVKFRYRGQVIELWTAGPNDHITGQIVGKKSFYEQDLLEEIRKLNLTGVYVDIGAHVGNHAVYFARYCNATHVIAVEADPELAEICEKNLEGHGSYEVVPYACYDGFPVKLVKHNRKNSGMQSVESDFDGRPSKTLADILGGEKPVLIKIDIEGGEPVVLWDALPLLREYEPVLVIESRTDAEYKDTEDKLRELGYRSNGPFALTPTYIWRVH